MGSDAVAKRLEPVYAHPVPASLPGVLSKRDYIFLAMLLLGGVDRFVDAEDIAVECYKLNAPAFRWVKYDYPSLGTVLDALRNIKKELGPDYIISPRVKSTQYRLTALGLELARDIAQQFVGRPYKSTPALANALRAKFATAEPTGRPTQVDVDPRRAAAMLRAITNHPTYRAWREGRLERVQRWQLTDVLQCLPDASQGVIRERLLYYQGLAHWSNRPHLDKFLAALASALGQHL